MKNSIAYKKKKRVLINRAEKCYGVSDHYVNSLKQ